MNLEGDYKEDIMSKKYAAVNATYVAHAASVAMLNATSNPDLNYVYIEPMKEGVLIAAMTPYMFVAYHDKKGTSNFNGLVRIDDSIVKAMKKKSNGGGVFEIHDDESCTYTPEKGASLRQEKCVGHLSFPDYAVFYNRAEQYGKGNVVPTALEAKALSAIAPSDKSALVFYQTGCFGQVYVRDLRNPDFSGIIMPLKINKHADSKSIYFCDANNTSYGQPVPDWLSEHFTGKE